VSGESSDGLCDVSGSGVDAEPSDAPPAGFDDEDADPAGEAPADEPEEVPDADEPADESDDDESPAGSAYAMPGVEATATPTPDATANAPTRPTCLA
jgi:hypothetical protein